MHHAVRRNTEGSSIGTNGSSSRTINTPATAGTTISIGIGSGGAGGMLTGARLFFNDAEDETQIVYPTATQRVASESSSESSGMDNFDYKLLSMFNLAPLSIAAATAARTALLQTNRGDRDRDDREQMDANDMVIHEADDQRKHFIGRGNGSAGAGARAGASASASATVNAEAHPVAATRHPLHPQHQQKVGPHQHASATTSRQPKPPKPDQKRAPQPPARGNEFGARKTYKTTTDDVTQHRKTYKTTTDGSVRRIRRDWYGARFRHKLTLEDAIGLVPTPARFK
jgi:hypothetical protein